MFKIIDRLKNKINKQCYDQTNKVYLIDNKKGTKKLVRSNGIIKGLSIEFLNSKNNIIEIEEPYYFRNTRIVLRNDNNKIYIKDSVSIISAYINMGGGEFEIGKNFQSVYNNRFYLGRQKVHIGDDCLFSRYICFYASDGHFIYDLETNNCINFSNNENIIKIGNRVWLGDSVMVLKNSEILNDSVVGAMSLINKKFCESNVIIAGNPGEIVKRGIYWKP